LLAFTSLRQVGLQPFWPGVHRLVRLVTIAVVLSVGGTVMATEEPTYEVVKRYPEFELRRYAPMLVATTEVDAGLEEAGRAGFRVLADFIFGNNHGRTKIEMTTPVNQQPAGERIAMTAPVGQQPIDSASGADRYVVTFVMPARFSRETLPVPTDPRVQIEEIPARLMAVRRYSGRWTEANYRSNEQALLRAVGDADLTPIAEPVYARYDPPFKPWFLRRNEVQVEVSEPVSQVR